MEDVNQYSKMEESVKEFFKEPQYIKPSTTPVGLYQQIKYSNIGTSITTPSITTSSSGLFNSYVTQSQLASLQGIMITLQHEVLEQREQIDILTKAVEQLLEQKLETFKKHE